MPTRGWFGFWSATREPFRLFSEAATNQTVGMMRALLVLGGGMTLLIVLTGLSWQVVPSARLPGVHPVVFVFWSLTTAFAAFLAGAALGLLFGLPTTLRRADLAGGGDEGRSTGYLDSTSLEQVADFLVKGIVALTLTTYRDWSARFETLAGGVTGTILSSSASDPVPGGLLLTSYAVLGFLLSYLWMRRWFIGELVTAQNEQQALLGERARAEGARQAEAQRDGRQGVGSSTANNSEASAQVATEIADTALRRADDPAAREGAEQIRDAIAIPQASDDPWKGAFGGGSASNGCVLSANVSPLVLDPNNFQVDLLLTIDEARRGALAGRIAQFFLHPTFGSRPRDVTIGSDGRATLQLFSYGAFTVGVLVDDGTRLELDLAQIAGAPRRFLDR